MVSRIQDSLKTSKSIALLCLFLAALSLLSCKTEEEEEKANKKYFPFPLYITAFGASIVKGNPENNFEDLLQAKLIQTLDSTVVVYNRGIAGQTTEQGLGRIRTVLKETKPAYILITLGTNDALQAHSNPGILPRTYANMDSIVYICLQHRTTPILSTLTGIDLNKHEATLSKNLQAINSAYRNIAEKYRIPFLDVYTPFNGHPEYFAPDGLHLNAEGYQVLAQKWYDIILK
jgi:acyl-CoA thioesterase I